MRVFVSGINNRGQLNGIINQSNDFNSGKINELIEMKLNFKIKLIACGYYYVLILTENNELYGCGANEAGQLGVGDFVDKYEFTKIDKFLENYNNKVNLKKKLSLVKSYLFKNKNKNINNETEMKTTSDSLNFYKIKSIACGGCFSVLLTTNNNLYLTGQAAGKQLGFKNKYNLSEFTKCNFNFGKIKTVKCTASSTVVLNENGEFYKYYFNYTFEMIYCNPYIVDFHCGCDHVVFLDIYGQIFYLIGKNREIIHCKLPYKIKQISCYYGSFTFLNEMNELFLNYDHFYLKQDKFIKIDLNNKVDKLFSGISEKQYFTTTTGNIYSLFVSGQFKSLNNLNSENVFKEKYIYPVGGFNFTYVIVSNTPLFGAGYIKKETERMFKLLIEQLTEKQTFCDISFKIR